MVGRELLEIDVIDIKPWVMHAEVAEKYVSCDNRILLAGDAAHRFPPAGGFGEYLPQTKWKFCLCIFDKNLSHVL